MKKNDGKALKKNSNANELKRKVKYVRLREINDADDKEEVEEDALTSSSKCRPVDCPTQLTLMTWICQFHDKYQ